eukprot:6387286-Prymnesium_polylepis.1
MSAAGQHSKLGPRAALDFERNLNGNLHLPRCQTTSRGKYLTFQTINHLHIRLKVRLPGRARNQTDPGRACCAAWCAGTRGAPTDASALESQSL